MREQEISQYMVKYSLNPCFCGVWFVSVQYIKLTADSSALS